MRWLHLRFSAPLASFGGEIIDSYGFTRDFPARSMMAGFLGNALGWDRGMGERLQALQDRIVFGAIREYEHPNSHLTDYQTAKLNKNDKAWTTDGSAAGRDGGAGTYAGSHQRWRDFHSDLRMSVTLRLDPEAEEPTLDQLGDALKKPARPLFIGRKPCLPSAMVFEGWVEGEDAYSSLIAAIASLNENEGIELCGPANNTDKLQAMWPADGKTDNSDSVQTTEITDDRNWQSGLHGGARRISYGLIPIQN